MKITHLLPMITNHAVTRGVECWAALCGEVEVEGGEDDRLAHPSVADTDLRSKRVTSPALRSGPLGRGRPVGEERHWSHPAARTCHRRDGPCRTLADAWLAASAHHPNDLPVTGVPAVVHLLACGADLRR